MSTFSSQLAIHHSSPLTGPSAVRKRLVLLRLFYNFVFAVMTGTNRASGFDLIYNGEGGAKGTQTVVFSSGSGTVGVLVSNVSLTVTWATSDTASMTALAAVVNASVNALVQFQVQMSNTLCTLTLASVASGTIVRLGQYDFTARANSGLVQNWGDFDISGSDTADATALAAAISAHPAASKYWVATSAAAVVSVFLLSTPSQADGSTSTNVSATAATVTVSGQPAAGATGVIASYKRDRVVNAITTVATGTGVTVGGSRITGGLGGNAVPAQEAL